MHCPQAPATHPNRSSGFPARALPLCCTRRNAATPGLGPHCRWPVSREDAKTRRKTQRAARKLAASMPHTRALPCPARPAATPRSSGFPARAHARPRTQAVARAFQPEHCPQAHISPEMRLSRRFALPVARPGGKTRAVWLVPTPSRSRLAGLSHPLKATQQPRESEAPAELPQAAPCDSASIPRRSMVQCSRPRRREESWRQPCHTPGHCRARLARPQLPVARAFQPEHTPGHAPKS